VTGSNPGNAGETEVVVTRVFNAPRDVVFKFWTEPEQFAKWWGPAGYYTPPEDVVIELRAGGRFQLHMVQTATGAEVWVHGEIVEVVAPEILAISMDVPRPIGLPPMKTIVRVEFDDLGDKTRITLRQGPFATAEQREQTAAGWIHSFGTLDQLLLSGSGQF
jgi:uncharacterized protein YndB with AHSA1/START domain